MKHLAITFCAATLLFACKTDTKVETSKTDTSSSALTAVKTEEWVPVDSATAMKNMMEAGTPGKEQAMLAKYNGTWQAETTMWMEPGGAPMVSKGVVTNKMILGGRYQQMTYKGDMMGAPFEGISTAGYDNVRKVWTSSWVDNMGTGIINMDGTWDEATKTFTSSGKYACPANGKMCEMKQVQKIVDDNTQIMEMYGPDLKTGKQYKNMEMKLTRKG